MPLTNHHEQKLLKGLRKGDKGAFEQLFQVYKARLYAFSIKLVKSEDLAADVVHDIFVKLWNNRRQIDPSGNFNSYLHTICKNHIFNLLKSASRREKLKLEIIHAISQKHYSMEEELYYREYEKIANEAVNQLPPRRKEVFRMCKMDGKSYSEVADNFGISKNTVKDHIVKASSFIKNYCNKHGDLNIE